MSLLSVSELTVATTDGTRLVRRLSFELAAGARLGLIGESGSGKSLTALAITGLLAPGLGALGSILLGGTEVVGADERTLAKLRGPVAAVVFQDPLSALDPLMRIGAQLSEPLRRHQGLRGVALKQAVTDALTEVSLPDPERISRSYPHEVSGGQRQRVAIALALACRPELLIADEPTTALDVTVQAEVLDLLDRIVAERNMALLFISHDLAVVARMTDQVIVMSAGEAVESGSLAALLAAPGHPYTAELVRSARTLDAALELS
ncbi:ATP-binding cassette domain-containing protein [Leifsonia sp. YAF41]|uniref:ATP-binding cassette domain-containing protein n=1 Tax=Leifsonia sp. YAF41 TaxID=3233086 RepID=UPI003F9B86BA